MDNILEDFDATLGGLIPASFVVSAWSLFFTAILFVVAFALTKAFARHMSGTEQCVFIWLAWDAMIHFSVEVSWAGERRNGRRSSAPDPLTPLRS